MGRALLSVGGLLAVTSAVALLQSTSKETRDQPVLPSTSLEAARQRAHFAWKASGALWRSAHSTYAAEVSGSHFTLRPFAVTEAGELETPGDPVRFEVKVGDLQADDAPRTELDEGGRLHRVHAQWSETFASGPSGVELSWTFATRPSRRALDVQLAFPEARVSARTVNGVHVQAGPLWVQWGHGTWIDADGTRTSIPAELEGSTIHFRVPDEVLARSRFPAVLDPLVGPERGIGEVLFGPSYYEKSKPSVASSGTDFFVVWQDFRVGNVSDITTSYCDILGARVNAAGEPLDPAGLGIAILEGQQLDPAVSWDGTHYLVTWSDTRVGATSTDVYAAHVDPATGQVLERGGFPLVSGPAQNEGAVTRQTGDLINVAWFERLDGGRIWFGALQRDGGWNQFPVAPTNRPTGVRPRMGCELNQCVVVWDDQLDGGQWSVAAMVSNTSLQTIAGPTVPFLRTQGQAGGDVAWDPSGEGWFFVWTERGADGGSENDVYSGRLDATLTPITGPEPLATGDGQQVAPRLALGASMPVVVWVDRPPGNTSILTASTPLPGAEWADGGVRLTANTSLGNANLAGNSSGQFLLVWDEQVGPLTGAIRSRLVDPTQPLLDRDGGTRLSASARLQFLPRLATNGTTYFMTYFEAVDRVTYELRGVALDPDGVPLGPSRLITTAPNTLAHALTWDGQRYVTAWTNSNFTTGGVYVQRLGVDSASSDPAPFSLGNDGGSYTTVGLTRGEGGSLITWFDNSGNIGGYATHLPDQGPPMTPPAMQLPIYSMAFTRGAPSAIWTGDRYLVSYVDNGSLVGLRIAPGERTAVGGTPLMGDGGVLPSGAVFSTGDGGLLVWALQVPDAGLDLRAAFVRLDGTPETSQPFTLFGGPGDQSSLALAWTGSGAMALTTTAARYDLRRMLAGVVTTERTAPVDRQTSIADGGSPSSPALACIGRRCLAAYVTFDETPGVLSRRVVLKPLAQSEAAVPTDQQLSTPAGAPVEFTLAATDADGDPLTFRIDQPPSHGSVSGTAPGPMTYTPDFRFVGTETFQFVVNDGFSDSIPGVVTIEVLPQCSDDSQCSSGAQCLEQICRVPWKLAVGFGCSAVDDSAMFGIAAVLLLLRRRW